MRVLVIGIGIAALMWSGYWLYGSRQASADVRGWLAQRADAGWTAQVADVATRGFPNRFDTTVTELDLRTDTGIGWTAPFVQILRLSYKPEHAILIFPARQTVSFAGVEVGLASERFRASTVFTRGGRPVLDRANAAIEGLSLTGGGLGVVTIGEVLAAIRTSAARASAHDLAVELRDVTLPAPGDAPAAVWRAVTLDATARFDAPLSLAAIDAGHLALTEIVVNRLQIRSDSIDISASGTLTQSGSGQFSGTLQVIPGDWRGLLQMAVGHGLIGADLRDAIATEMTGLAKAIQEGQALTVPLDFRRGEIFLNSLRLN